MNKLKLIEVAVIIFLMSYINSTANDSIYSKDPILVLQGNAGDQPGEFGMDINFGVSDFIVDINNDIWILDWGNFRIQKFSEDGEYIASYPNDENKYPMELRCEYIETDLKGNIYLDLLTSAQLIVINNNGHFLRTIDLPTRKGIIYDFAVTGSGDVLIPKAGDIVALDEYGEINYAVENVNIIYGENSTPFSPHLFHFNFKTKVANVYPQGLKKSVTEDLTYKINFAEFQHDTTSISSKGIMLIDKYQNFFVSLSLGNTIFRTQSISYNSKDGKQLAVLNMPNVDINTRIYSMLSALDKNGNFYLMQHFLPEDVNPQGPPDFLKSNKPCLYIWKWKRNK